MSQEERQAIGRNNQDARRAIGQRMVDDRKAIAAGISASRASTFKRDLNSLESAPRRTAELSQREARGTRPPTVGRGNYVAPPSAGQTGGGIASPLTEKTKLQDGVTVADREYYAQGSTSSDGLLVLPAIKKQTFADANTAEVVLLFATPGGLP